MLESLGEAMGIYHETLAREMSRPSWQPPHKQRRSAQRNKNTDDDDDYGIEVASCTPEEREAIVHMYKIFRAVPLDHDPAFALVDHVLTHPRDSVDHLEKIVETYASRETMKHFRDAADITLYDATIRTHMHNLLPTGHDLEQASAALSCLILRREDSAAYRNMCDAAEDITTGSAASADAASSADIFTDVPMMTIQTDRESKNRHPLKGYSKTRRAQTVPT